MENAKKKVLWWALGCLVVIGIFHFAWSTYLFQLWGPNLFTIIDALLFGGFIGTSVSAYALAEDPNYDYLYRVFIWLAVASSIWAAAWSTGLMNNLSQGI